jgi:hypothetical protein
MPQTSRAPKPALHLNYRLIFASALKAYEEKTGKGLSSDPLLRSLESCNSSGDIITILRHQIPESNQSRSRLTRWLNPTVNVIKSFSASMGWAVDIVSPRVRGHTSKIYMLNFITQAPARLMFTAIGVLLSSVNPLFPFNWAIITSSYLGR